MITCPAPDTASQQARPERTAYRVIAHGLPGRPGATLGWRATRDTLDNTVAQCFALGYLAVSVRADDGRSIKLEIGE
jgi:hypothetical protein